MCISSVDKKAKKTRTPAAALTTTLATLTTTTPTITTATSQTRDKIVQSPYQVNKIATAQNKKKSNSKDRNEANEEKKKLKYKHAKMLLSRLNQPEHSIRP